MELKYHPEAVADLKNIYEWVAKDSPSAAARVVGTLRKRMSNLIVPELVNLGRPGRRGRTRELVERPYIIVYEAKQSEVIILQVVHGAQGSRR